MTRPPDTKECPICYHQAHELLKLAEFDYACQDCATACTGCNQIYLNADLTNEISIRHGKVHKLPYCSVCMRINKLCAACTDKECRMCGINPNRVVDAAIENYDGVD